MIDKSLVILETQGDFTKVQKENIFKRLKKINW